MIRNKTLYYGCIFLITQFGPEATIAEAYCRADLFRYIG